MSVDSKQIQTLPQNNNLYEKLLETRKNINRIPIPKRKYRKVLIFIFNKI